MKKTKVFIALIVLLYSNISFAMNGKKNDSTGAGAIVAIIQEIVKKSDLEFKNNISADVCFLINHKNEIIVVSVDSDYEELNQLLIDKLHKYELKKVDLKKDKKYILPVRLIDK